MNLRTALAAATVLTTLLSSPAAAHTAGQPDGAPAYRSGPKWGHCPAELKPHPRQQCADIEVPLDYRHPQGPKIKVKTSRIPAANPSSRLGTLVLLPGGPGNGGLHWPTDYYGDDQPPALRDRYDLVGFDARGIRYSNPADTPVTCGLAPHDRGPRYPAADGSIDAMVAYSHRTAEACLRHSGPAIRHITTANTARDLDRIRAALGERRISLYGLSYGTYLGAAYASLFPDRTDRVVLDSAIDPRRAWYDFTRLGGQGLADRLPDLTTWIAARHQLYGLGRTPQQVHQRYRSITAGLDAHPLDQFDGNQLRRHTLDALKQPADRMFPAIADLWTAVAALPAASTADASANGMKQRSAVDTPLDNNIAVEYAITCGDAAWPRDVRFYRAAVRLHRHRFPDDAGRSANITPCAFWPAPLEEPVRIHDRGPRNILVVQNRRDPATPWISGLGMRRAFGDRAALITADFGGHGVIGHQRCATMVALDYVVTDARQLPGDPVCPA
jgi:pimeloyl-ACP methyl ester carboxylesterase